MAKFLFAVTGEGTKSVLLPVTTAQVGPVLLNGLEAKGIPFTITNDLSRAVAFTTVDVLVEGSGKDKVSAIVRFDNISIDPGGTFDNFLDVESIQELTEEDKFTITVSSQEATPPSDV